jgi:NAD(P)-dependent dehydrogenase (short-subunit alcohol dehydrogenase family)
LPATWPRFIDQFDLTGRRAIVTGGAGDIGQVAVHAFLQQGASVTIFDTNTGRVDLAGGPLSAYAGSVHLAQGSVGEDADIERLLAGPELADGVDILVNAAAIQSRHGFDTREMAGLDALWEINTRGLINLTQRVVRGMIARGRGSVINVGSIGSLTGLRNKMAYSVTKGAVGLFTRSLAVEVGGRGVRVNAIAPGTIVTQFNRDWLEQNDDVRAADLKRIPMSRFGDAGELAGAFLLLASDAGSYINGELLVIDGGRLAGA